MSNARSAHVWHFFRAGGFSQVLLTSADDLRALGELDQKLWVALGCPASGLEFDEKTLALIDADKDARIRVPEVLAAVAWVCEILKDPAAVFTGSPSLPLGAIRDDTPAGKVMLASARQILSDLGKKDAASICIDDTTDTARIFAQTRFNGDGIVPADAADDAKVRLLIEEVIACMGAKTDRSGKPGVDQASLDAFIAAAQAYSAWWAQADSSAKEVFALGDATPAAAAALGAVRAKIDDYFARCRLAAFDPRALSAVNRQESEYLAIASRELSLAMPEMASFPIALVQPGKPLPLAADVNPAWADAVAAFRKLVAQPIAPGRTELDEEDWAGIKARFAPYESWLAAKAGAPVEPLGIARVRQILAEGRYSAVAALIASDKALEGEASAISDVDKLARFHRDLGVLLNNFVSFRDFYQRRGKAVFQVGTLYLDQRACDLCVRIDDPARHATLAPLSRTYLAYCDLTRRGTGEKMTVAAAFTDGDSDHLMVGRNGIFYDRKGRDWDATIVKVVENPISIRQAFWAPYKRALRWVEEQIAKRAAASDAAAADKVTAVASGAAKPPADQKPKFDVGVIAALGVAVGGVTAALGYVLQAFFGLGLWMPLGLVAMISLISGPSMIIAWLKLRQRNLGPILDANGWAVNVRAKVNVPLGRSLTSVAKLPALAHVGAVDPFAESKAARNTTIAAAGAVVLLLALWYFGALNAVLPEGLQRSLRTGASMAGVVQAASMQGASGAAAVESTAPAKK
jgi:hypothetical protein